MIPDPTTGRILRALAVLAYSACAVFALVAQSGCKSTAERATARRIVSVGGAVTEPVFALGAGSDVVLLAGGTVVGNGPPSDVFTPPHLSAAYSTSFEVLRGESGLVIVSR